MRSGLFLSLMLLSLMLWATSISMHAWASPGDKYNASEVQDTQAIQTTIIKRRARSNDTPLAPAGFRAVKLSERLGDVGALASLGSDLFVLDRSKGRVLRLRDTDQNGHFEIRSEFLVGFNQASSLAISEGHIFISDADGIWQIKIGKALAASARPKNILPVAPNTYSHASRPITLSLDGNLLYVGLNDISGAAGRIAAIDLRSRKPSIFANGNWNVHALTISPSGSLIAGLEQNNTVYIAEIKNGQANIEAGLSLMPSTNVSDLLFWNAGTYDKTWPQIWKRDLIMALSGDTPMIARAQYSFGGISPEYTSIVSGFSQTSLMKNRMQIWGNPSALTLLPNGDFLFAEQNGGTLWRFEKTPAPRAVKAPISNTEEEIFPPAPPSMPSISMGSTMRGSSIENASALGKDELLTGKKKPRKKYTYGKSANEAGKEQD